MKIVSIPFSLLALILPLLAQAAPLDKAGLAAVEELGRLNGIALNCRYFDQVRNIKQTLIDRLPKRRELGQIFEQKTDESFKAFIQSGSACPSPATFAAEVDKATHTLAEIYPPN
ncbi:hypothetical protein [Thiolapillus sp.]